MFHQPFWPIIVSVFQFFSRADLEIFMIGDAVPWFAHSTQEDTQLSVVEDQSLLQVSVQVL